MGALDWSTIIIFIVELLLIIPALIYSVLAFKRVCLDGCLHFPFRACLTVICFRIYPHSIQFFAESIGRLAVYGDAKQLPYQRILESLEVLEVYGTAFSELCLAVERIVAIIDPKYELRFVQLWKKILIVLGVNSCAVFLTVNFAILNYHSTGKTARFLLLAAFLLSLSTMVLTFRKARKTRGRRHTLRLELGQRFATQENLKAATLYLPILVNELICEVVKMYDNQLTFQTLLVYFVSAWTKTVYILDIITAFQCLFYSSFLFHRHRRLMSKSSELSIFASPQATENYFSSYAAAWK